MGPEIERVVSRSSILIVNRPVGWVAGLDRVRSTNARSDYLFTTLQCPANQADFLQETEDLTRRETNP